MRKLKISTWLLAGVLASVTEAVADPLFAPFLSVDINGYNAAGGQTLGPTQAGFAGWEVAEGFFLPPSIDWPNSGPPGLNRVFATSQGNVTANLRGVAPNSNRIARNRGDNGDFLGDVTQDFASAQLNVNGLGRHFIKLTLSGLIPNQSYEATVFNRDQIFTGADSFQAWTDLAAIGGVDGPGFYLDDHVAPNAVYQPAPGGVNNPIPTLARAPVSGPASDDPYAYSASFFTIASEVGVVTLYGWADPDTSIGAEFDSLLNGFQLGLVQELFLLGDYSQNGVVDAADYTVWRDHLGENLMLYNQNPFALTPNVVNQEDYEYWRSSFGRSFGGLAGTGSIAAIPEPAAGFMLLTGTVVMFTAFRKQRSMPIRW